MRRDDLAMVMEAAATFAGHRYLVAPVLQNRARAVQTAERLGGRLVHITSASENQFVRNLAGRYYVWLGIGSSLDGKNVSQAVYPDQTSWVMEFRHARWFRSLHDWPLWLSNGMLRLPNRWSA